MNEFSERLKRARKKAGLSQTELAELAGMSRRTIMKYESSEVAPNLAKITPIVEALGISTDQLLGTGDLDSLLEQNKALFAGGNITQEEKSAFFEAIMKAYIACKEDSKGED